jgi:hypothetical protein
MASMAGSFLEFRACLCFASVFATLLAYRLLVTFGGIVYPTSVPGGLE